MIKIENIEKSYIGQKVLFDINLQFDEGGLYCLIGESGSGKTTIMKLINRLITPTNGKIFINDKDISTLNPVKLRRSIGYVIQKVGLFPHMTVGQNIEVVLDLLKIDKVKRKEKALELLELVEIEKNYYNKYPCELSGGQQQRIGIARALSTDPEILLMDEPFSALDPITRENLQDELLDLQRKLKKTIIFVTHDMDEAIKLSDKIAIIKDGKVIQFDTPEEILKNPADDFVEYFIGKDRLWKTPELFLVKDIMKKKFPKVLPDMGISKAFEKMKQHDKEFVFVVEDGKLVGGISKDILFQQGSSSQIKIKDIMIKDLLTLDRNENLLDALTKMEQSKNKIVAVVDESSNIKGMVTPTALLNVIYEIKPESGDINELS